MESYIFGGDKSELIETDSVVLLEDFGDTISPGNNLTSLDDLCAVPDYAESNDTSVVTNATLGQGSSGAIGSGNS